MNRDLRLGIAVAAIAGLCVLVELAGLDGLLRYERAAIAAGQPWRLLSAHLVHLGPAHLALNAAGLALVALLVGHAWSLPAWSGMLLACAAATGAGLWWFAPGVAWYVGLSGVLHGLLVAGAARELARAREPVFHAIVLAVVALKLVWEQIAGGLPGTADLSGGTVIVDAHLFGTIGGVLAAVLLAGMQFIRAAGGRQGTANERE